MRLFSRTPGIGFRGSRIAFTCLGMVVLMGGVAAEVSFGAPLTQPRMGGRSRGGETPISGATITLYETGTTGYGSTPNLLAATVTDSGGNFNITGYTCTSPSSLLYLTSVGGNAGNGNNSAISLTAMLGPCVHLPSYVVINEVTTVAAVYALARFSDPANPDHIGGPTAASGSHNGINDAATLSFNNLANVTTGTAASFLSTGVNSPATINTLADILTPCVNSGGPGSAECLALFSATTVGGTVPTTTLGAVLSVALHPGSNADSIYAILQTATSQPGGLPFVPTLTAAPTDWLLALNYTQKSFAEIRGLAIDASGNVWVGNSLAPSLVELSPLGALVMNVMNAGLANPQTPAIDSMGNIWVANNTSNTVTAVASNGSVLVTTPAGAGGLNQPLGVAIDPQDNVWIANFTSLTPQNGSLTQLCGAVTANCPNSLATGSPISPSAGFVGGGLHYPSHVAIDNLFTNVWASNLGTGGASEFDASGAPLGHFSGGGQEGELGITIDPLGNVWTANKTSVTELNSSGAVLQGPIVGGGISTMSRPFGIGSDSTGNIWVTNFQGNSVTEIAPDGTFLSPAGGFTAGGLLNYPRNSIAVDASGNVWLTMNQPSSVTELVGASTPVKTPLIGRPVLP